eukprot:750423-Amphidinium_carterae.1
MMMMMMMTTTTTMMMMMLLMMMPKGFLLAKRTVRMQLFALAAASSASALQSRDFDLYWLSKSCASSGNRGESCLLVGAEGKSDETEFSRGTPPER